MTETTQPQASRTQRSADSQLKRNWAKLRRNKAGLFGGLLILTYFITALLAPLLFPGSPSAPKLMKSLERPSIEPLLGTDELGRSILGRIIYGSRVSLLIAIGVVAVGLLVGLPLGLISGYYGGKVDFGIQRVTDTMLAFPGFLLALALVAVLGVGLKNTIISVGIRMGPFYICLVGGGPPRRSVARCLAPAGHISLTLPTWLPFRELPYSWPSLASTSRAMACAMSSTRGLGYETGISPL